MRTIYYFILMLLGIVLSVPMTIIIIAWQQANFDADKIKKYLLEKQFIKEKE